MLKLILPVIFPSWRFFSSIGPSPRIQISYSSSDVSEAALWQDFRPLPQRVSITDGLRRLFLNSQWNESLYLNTCAERLFEGHSEVREQEIMHRILRAIRAGDITSPAYASHVSFRIKVVTRNGTLATEQIVFLSNPVLLNGDVL